MKCITPSHEAGKVDLRLFFDGIKTDFGTMRKPQIFEFKEKTVKNLKKRKARNDNLDDTTTQSESQWLLNKDEGSNREFKVRIVERLTFLEQKLNGSNAPSG